MHRRIDHLEDLVKRLIAERQQISPPSKGLVYTPESPKPETGSTPSAVASDDQGVAGASKTVMDGIRSVYLGGDDWYAVLQEVRCCLFAFALTLISAPSAGDTGLLVP